MSHLQGTDYVGSHGRHGGRPAPAAASTAASRSGRSTRTTTTRPWRRCSPAGCTAYLAERDKPVDERRRRFAYPPQLLLVDGGKGQLAVAVRVVEALGLDGRDPGRRRWPSSSRRCSFPGQADPIRIPRTSEALYLLQRIRDEAHRFAITYHRQLRGKRMTASVLDDIPGLGPAREAAGQGAGRRQGGQGGRARDPEEPPVAARQGGRRRVRDRSTSAGGPVERRRCRTRSSRRPDDGWVAGGAGVAVGPGGGGARTTAAGPVRRRRVPAMQADRGGAGGDAHDGAVSETEEQSAGWDDPHVVRGGRPASPTGPTPSTTSRSSRWRPRTWPARGRVLDVGCGEGQIARLAAGRPGDPVSSASTPPGSQLDRGRGTRRRGVAYARAAAAALPFPPASSTPSIACLVFEHIDDVDAAIAEVGRVLRPGRPVSLLPQPSAAPDARQRVDRRPHPRRAVLAHRALPDRGRTRWRRWTRASGSRSSTDRCPATSTPWWTPAC